MVRSPTDHLWPRPSMAVLLREGVGVHLRAVGRRPERASAVQIPGGDGAAAATVAEQRADALHSIVDQLTEAEAELLAELLATRTAQAWDPGVASRAEAGLA